MRRHRITGGFGGASAERLLQLLRPSSQVDVDPEEHDRPIGDELRRDGHGRDEQARGDQVAVVIAIGIQSRQLVKALGDDYRQRWQLHEQEIAG